MTLICLVAAAALAYTFAKTRVPIEQSRRAELVKALEFVLPAKTKIEEKPVAGVTGDKLTDEQKIFVAVDESGAPAGYAAIGSAQGYSSSIVVMVGMDLQGQIYAIRILSQSETPGLGERTREVPPTKSLWAALGGLFEESKPAAGPVEPPFQVQFRGKTMEQLELAKLPSSKDRIVQLTGATITSQAVVNAVRDAVAKVNNTTKQ